MRCTPTQARRRTPTGRQIVALYDQLLRCSRRRRSSAQPCGRSGRGRTDPARRSPSSSGSISTSYHLFHATRADLLDAARAAHGEALAAYDTAIGLTENAAERALLERRQAAVPYGARRD